MSRVVLPFHVDDLTGLARSLRAPGRGIKAAEQPAAPAPTGPPVDFRQVERFARCFVRGGRLLRWPSKQSERPLAFWVVWSRLPAKEAFLEQQISQRLQVLHGFDDHALLLTAHHDYIRRHGEDMPRIRNWHWQAEDQVRVE